MIWTCLGLSFWPFSVTSGGDNIAQTELSSNKKTSYLYQSSVNECNVHSPTGRIKNHWSGRVAEETFSRWGKINPSYQHPLLPAKSKSLPYFQSQRECAWYQHAAGAGEWIDNDFGLCPGLPACSECYTSSHYRLSSSPAYDLSPLEDTDSFLNYTKLWSTKLWLCAGPDMAEQRVVQPVNWRAEAGQITGFCIRR